MSSPSAQNAISVLDRLKRALRAPTDTRLGEILGVNQNTVSSWRSRDTLPYARIIALCDEQGFSLDWVFTGEGEPPPSVAEGEADGAGDGAAPPSEPSPGGSPEGGVPPELAAAEEDRRARQGRQGHAAPGAKSGGGRVSRQLRDHPSLRAVHTQPAWVVRDAAGDVTFRVSYLVEATPPVESRGAVELATPAGVAGGPTPPTPSEPGP